MDEIKLSADAEAVLRAMLNSVDGVEATDLGWGHGRLEATIGELRAAGVSVRSNREND